MSKKERKKERKKGKKEAKGREYKRRKEGRKEGKLRSKEVNDVREGRRASLEDKEEGQGRNEGRK